MSSKPFVLIALGLVLMVILVGNVKASTLTDCGTVSARGYYDLTGNITSANTCLTINVSNVEIDCKGYMIEYANTGTATRFGIDVVLGTMPLENITVRNCLIKKQTQNNTAGYGIRMQRTSNSRILNNTINTNGTTNNYGLYLLTSCENNLVENNTITAYGNSTGNIGLYLASGSSANVIRNNNISGKGTTTSYALLMYYDSNYNTIDTNKFYTYSTAGTGNTDSNTVYLSTSSYNNLSNNYIYSNGATRNYPLYVYLNSVRNTFRNNTIEGVFTAGTNYGVYSVDSTLNYYEGNNISISGTVTQAAILLTRSDYNEGVNNTLSVTGTTPNYALYLANANHNKFNRGTYYVNGSTANYAVYLNYGHNNEITNSFINLTGTTTTNYGIYALYANRNLIENNSVYTSRGTSGNPALVISTSLDNIVKGNNLSASGTTTTNYGIYLLSTQGNNVINNYITTNGTTTNYGVYLSTGATSNRIDNNTILPGGTTTLYGVYLTTVSSNNTISNNYIVSNGSTQSGTTNNQGVYLVTNSDDNTIENNTIRTGGGTPNYGVYILTDSNNNKIRGNTISTAGSGASNHGIYIYSSHNNLAENNIISASGTATDYGIDLALSSWHNTLRNNTISASGSTNSHGIFLTATAPNYPNYNNLSRNTFSSVSGSELYVGTASIDYLWLIDQTINSYLFTGIGSFVNLKNETAGEIQFLARINGSGTGFSNSLKISENYAYVNSSNSGFNKSAQITIYNRSTSQTNLGIYREGVLCSSAICTNLTSLQAGNVTFNVTGWTYYSINASDEIPHIVNLTAPANNTNITTQNYNFNFTVTDENSSTFKCYVYINGSLSGSNESVSNGTETSISVSGINGGVHAWYVSCLDEGNWSRNSETRLIRNSIPSLIYNSPTNNSYLDRVSSVLLNITLSDTESSQFNVWFYGNGSVINYSSNVSTGTLTYNWTGLSLGQHNWSAVANDGFSNSTQQTYYFNIINLTLNCEAGGPYQSGALVLVQGNLTDGTSPLQSQNISLTIYDSSNSLVTGKNIASDASGNFHTSFSGLSAGNLTLNSSLSYQGINRSCTDALIVGGGATIQLDKIIALHNITNTSIIYNISLRSSNLGSSSLTNGNLVDSDSASSPYTLGTLNSASSSQLSYLKTYTRNTTTYNSTLAIATLNGTDSYSGNALSTNSSQITLIVPASDIDQKLTLIKNAYFNSENTTSVNYTMTIEVVNSGGDDLVSITVIDSDLDVNQVINLNISQSWNYTSSLIISKEASNSERTFAKSSATVNATTYQSNQIKINIPGYGGPADTYVYAPASVETSTSFQSTIELRNMNPDIGQNFVVDYWITNDAETSNYSSGQSTTYVAASGNTNITLNLTSPSTAGTYKLKASASYIGGPDSAYDSFTVTDPSSGGQTGEGSSGGGGGSSITGRAIEEVVCNPPYIRYGKECCLDFNNNSICDTDEIEEEPKETDEIVVNETSKKPESENKGFLGMLSSISKAIKNLFESITLKGSLIPIGLRLLVFVLLLTVILIRFSRRRDERRAVDWLENKIKHLKELKIKREISEKAYRLEKENLLKRINKVLKNKSYLSMGIALGSIGLFALVSNKGITGRVTDVGEKTISNTRGVFFALVIILAGISILVLRYMRRRKKRIETGLSVVSGERTITQESGVGGKESPARKFIALDNRKVKRVSELLKKKVYTESGYLLGKITDVMLDENKIGGLMIKLHKKHRVKGVIINYKLVRKVGKIIILDSEILSVLDGLK